MPSKSMSPMPMQAKIGDASLKFGPDWLRALSSDTGVAPGSGGGASGGGTVNNSWGSGAGGGGSAGLFADRSNSGAAFSTVLNSSSSYHHHITPYQNLSSQNKDGKGNSPGSGATSGTGSGSVSKFKPSEFKYSREEMLALYDKNLDPPQYLPAFGSLFVDKMQPPLAFSQASEEELRIWHIAQPESSRAGGGTSTGPPPVGRGGYGIRGGRGSGVERGRGRGRGGGVAGGGYYARPHEDEDRSFSRPRAFERSQSAHERVWGERNGTVAGPGPSPTDENAPRGGSWRSRESFNSGTGGGGRRHDEDDSGWRSSKPRWRRDDEDDSPRNAGQRRLHKSWSEDGGHDSIPEWAKDNPCEESGTFDASGAFHGEDRHSSSNSSNSNSNNLGAKSSAADDMRREGVDPRSAAESEPQIGSQDDKVQKRSPERNESKLAIPPVEEGIEPPPEDDVRVASQSGSSREYRHELLFADRIPQSKQLMTHTNTSQSRSSGDQTQRGHVDLSKPETDASKISLASNNISNIVSPGGDGYSRLGSITHNHEGDYHAASITNTHAVSSVRAKTIEEDFFSMTEEADNLVAKLIEEDIRSSPPNSENSLDPVIQRLANHPSLIGMQSKSQPGSIQSAIHAASILHQEAQQSKSLPQQSSLMHNLNPSAFDTWLYRDPQGSVQGPFATHEMAQWNPFMPHPDSSPPPPVTDVVSGALDRPADAVPIPMELKYQQQQQHLLQMQREQQMQQSQQFMMTLAHNLGRGTAKVGEGWQTQSNPGVGSVSSDRRLLSSDIMLANLAQGQTASTDSNNPMDHVHAAFQRQLQGKATAEASQKNVSSDYLRSLIQTSTSPGVDIRKSPAPAADPIQSLVQQLTNMANSQAQSHQQQRKQNASMKDSNAAPLWGQPGSGMPQQQGMPWMPHSGNPMWDLQDQMIKMQHRQMHDDDIMRARREQEDELQRKREEAEQEAKRLEEVRRKEIEEEKRKQIEHELMMQQKQQEERMKEERLKQEQMARQKELARQKEMMLQQQRMQQMEQQRLQQERLEQQQRLQQQRLEQQRLEQQEQQRLEQQRMENERYKQERMEQERTEQERHTEQRKRMDRERERQAQELQAKFQQQRDQQERIAWQQQQQNNEAASKQQQPRSLLEIQQEEAMKQQQEEMMRQQMLKKQMQQQAEMQRQAQIQAQKTGFNLKWAQSAGPQSVPIKSLTEIQAEEQAKLAKQQERERQEQAVHQQHQQSQHAWNSAMTWANRASLNAPPAKSNGGVWDDPPLGSPQTSAKQKAVSPSSFGSNYSSTTTSAVGSSNTTPRQSSNANPSGGSALSQPNRKEAEDSVLKLLQDHSSQLQQHKNAAQKDDFPKWCHDTLSGFAGSVDIPVFVGFLKEVESPFEVADYCRIYLGDGKEAKDFSKEFLERRSRWKNSVKKENSDSVTTARGFDGDGIGRQAVSHSQSANDFQEVKGKGKKGKKGKMQKVDSRILGFNTTAAPDRLNVGKRDYGDGTE